MLFSIPFHSHSSLKRKPFNILFRYSKDYNSIPLISKERTNRKEAEGKLIWSTTIICTVELFTFLQMTLLYYCNKGIRYECEGLKLMVILLGHIMFSISNSGFPSLVKASFSWEVDKLSKISGKTETGGFCFMRETVGRLQSKYLKRPKSNEINCNNICSS